MEVQGKFKRRAHKSSGVVMDIAVFKVSHCVGTDKDTTALQAARARSVSIGAMEESSGQVQAHLRTGVVMDTAAFKVSHSVVSNRDATALRAVIARSSSIGAMEEMSGKVQNANTHIL